MSTVYAVLVKLKDGETVLDSVWDKVKPADKRSDALYGYGEVFRAEVLEIELNNISDDFEDEYEEEEDDFDFSSYVDSDEYEE
jgi:hypothetical protein